jgi:hypothetical protein
MKVLYDISTHVFNFYEFENIQFEDHFLKIGFRDNEKLPVFFSELSAEVSIFKDNEKIFYASFPDPGETYIQTDQDFVWVFNLYGLVIPEKPYILQIKISNDNHDEFVIQQFSLNRPDQLYPSWNWDEEIGQWLPPIPYPIDSDKPMSWSEETLSWIETPNISWSEETLSWIDNPE